MCVYSKTTIYICEELQIIHIDKIYFPERLYSDKWHLNSYDQLELFW